MKFTVKNLGSIKKADIEVKPLTIFVGENGTHKNYMAHVIYGIHNYILETGNILEREIIQKLLTNKFQHKISLSEHKIKQIYPYTVNLTKPSLNKMIKELFNSEIFPQNVKINIDFDSIENNEKELFGRAYYFPASRIGLTLAFNEIAKGSFKLYEGTSHSKLTRPTIDFLENLMMIKINEYPEEYLQRKNNKKIYKKIQLLIDFLQERILQGEIIEEQEKDKYVNFFFKPFHYNEWLELHNSDSSVLEILPILEFLKNFTPIKGNLLIIEEPEAHLHPKAQIEMARFLALLVNQGAKVLITTHSDFIISEINNCIKLSNLSQNEQKEFLQKENLEKYSQIAISQEDVNMFFFKEEAENIVVKKLNIDKFGIEDENFEAVIDKLFERTNLLSEKIMDY